MKINAMSRIALLLFRGVKKKLPALAASIKSDKSPYTLRTIRKPQRPRQTLWAILGKSFL